MPDAEQIARGLTGTVRLALLEGCDYDKGGYIEKPRANGGNYVTLQDFIAGGEDVNNWGKPKGKVAFIFAADIKPEERSVAMPRQGYVWVS